jgi:hypothetical protein
VQRARAGEGDRTRTSAYSDGPCSSGSVLAADGTITCIASDPVERL